MRNFQSNYALRRTRQGNHNFGEIFRYQYVISRDAEPWPDLSHYQLDGFHIYTGSALRVVALNDANGRHFGYALGVAVDENGSIIDESAFRNLHADDAGAWEIFTYWLDRICGRYAFILTIAGETRAYVDPVAMIGACYSRETKRLAASPFLCLDRDPIQNPYYPIEVITGGTGSYRFLHTIDASVRRLNPNHFFRLNDFSTQRFWPRPEHSFEHHRSQYAAAQDEIVALSKAYIGGMVKNFPVSIPLTGGFDSRMLMASAVDVASEVDQYFTHINNYANRRDAFTAQLMAEAAGVRLELHDKRQFSVRPFVGKKLAAAYQIGAGTNANAPLEVANGLSQQVKKDAIVIRGHQTNILRGQYVIRKDPKDWLDPYWQIMNMAVVNKKRAMDQNVANRFNAAFYDIYGDLPENALARSVDFVFLEGLVPNALGELFCGLNRAFYLSSFNSRRLVQLMMGFFTPERLSYMTTYDYLERADARLNRVPFIKEVPAALNQYKSGEVEPIIQKRLLRFANFLRGHDLPRAQQVLAASQAHDFGPENTAPDAEDAIDEDDDE